MNYTMEIFACMKDADGPMRLKQMLAHDMGMDCEVWSCPDNEDNAVLVKCWKDCKEEVIGCMEKIGLDEYDGLTVSEIRGYKE